MRPFPLRGLLYELRRTASKPSVLLAVAVVLLVSVGTFLTVPQGVAPPGVSVTREYSGTYYYASGAYVADFYAFDAFARPLVGVPFSLTFSQGDAAVAVAGGNTSASGRLQLSTELPPSQFNVSVDAGPTSDPSYFQSEDCYECVVQVDPSPPGGVGALGGPVAAPVTRLVGPVDQVGLQVFFPGSTGTPPGSDLVYYSVVSTPCGGCDDPAGSIHTVQRSRAIPGQGAPGTALPESSMTFLGKLGSSPEFFQLELLGTNGSVPSGQLQVEIFAGSGQLLTLDSNQSAGAFFVPQLTPPPAVAEFTFLENALQFLTPLVGIIGAYSVYGRDRVTGVLDSILAQPVTSAGLAISRYLALLVALGLGLAAAFTVFDAAVQAAVGASLPASTLAETIGAQMVVIAFFVGLVFALGHVSRSPNVILGVAIGLFEFFALLWWLPVQSLMGVLGYTSYTAATSATPFGFELHAAFLNPVFFPVVDWISFANTTYAPAGSINAQLFVLGGYGDSAAAVLVAGVAWSVAPLLALLALLRWRD